VQQHHHDGEPRGERLQLEQALVLIGALHTVVGDV
jgi:hypothetical protein